MMPSRETDSLQTSVTLGESFFSIIIGNGMKRRAENGLVNDLDSSVWRLDKNRRLRCGGCGLARPVRNAIGGSLLKERPPGAKRA